MEYSRCSGPRGVFFRYWGSCFLAVVAVACGIEAERDEVDEYAVAIGLGSGSGSSQPPTCGSGTYGYGYGTHCPEPDEDDVPPAPREPTCGVGELNAGAAEAGAIEEAEPNGQACAQACSDGTGQGDCDPVNTCLGDFEEKAYDFELPSAGPALRIVWAREYGSRANVHTSMGNWSHSYGQKIEITDVRREEGPIIGRRCECVPGAPDEFRRYCLAPFCESIPVHGPEIVHLTFALEDGNRHDTLDQEFTRADPAVTGRTQRCWAARDRRLFMCETAQGAYELTRPDGVRWLFSPFSSAFPSGRLLSILDRHGNRVDLRYGASGPDAGRLTQIVDTAGHSLALAYGNDGQAANLITSITDHTGRRFEYRYHDANSSEGADGDLATVTVPAETDGAEPRVWAYAYAVGTGDPRLDHNLLRITDGGAVILENSYSPAFDETAPDFDRVVSQRWGDGETRLTYESVSPSADNNQATSRTILNNRTGEVTEFLCDGSILKVERAYTGRSVPTFDAIGWNAPGAAQLKLRDGSSESGVTDPDVFETRYEYDARWRVAAIVGPQGDRTEKQYDMASHLTRRDHLPGPLGGSPRIGTSYEYDGWGELVRGRDARGQATTYERDARGSVIQIRYPIVTQGVASPQAAIENFTYDAQGRLATHTHPAQSVGATSQRRTDRRTYYASGPAMGQLATEVIDAGAGGRSLTTSHGWDALGNLLWTTDPLGRTTNYDVTRHGRVTRVQGPAPGFGITARPEQRQFYDVRGRLERVVTPRNDATTQPGLERRIHYHATLAQVLEDEILGGAERVSVRYEYDASGRQTWIKHPLGRDANIQYDERGLVYRVIEASGHPEELVTQYDYDAAGNLTHVTAGAGTPSARVTRMVYDGHGRRLYTYDPEGNEHRQFYDVAGNLTFEKWDGEREDGTGTPNVSLAAATYNYDERGRRYRSSRAHYRWQRLPSGSYSFQLVGDGQASTTWELAPASNAVAMIDDSGARTTFAYDSVGRVAEVRDAAGNVLRTTYDDASRPIERLRNRGAAVGVGAPMLRTTVVYDGNDQVRRTTDPALHETQATYDLFGRIVEARSGRGDPTRYHYDGLGRLLRTEHGTGVEMTTTHQEWDGASRLVARRDGLGHRERYGYDLRDRLVSIDGADLSRTTITRDRFGNPIERWDANGSVATTTFDRLDRPTQRLFTPAPGVSADTTFQRFGYDGASRLVRAIDDDSEVTWDYDLLGNVVAETRGGRTIGATWDGRGLLGALTYGDGRTVSYARDVIGRLTSVREGARERLRQDFAGPNLTRRTWDSGVTLDLGYDNEGLPSSMVYARNGAALTSSTTTWDASHNLDTRETKAFAYDSLDRLSSNSVDPPAYDRLDAANNRVGAGYQVGPMNRYVRSTWGAHTYDANGNVAGWGDHTAVYDALDQMTEHVGPTGVATRYRYDALGRRIGKRTDGGDETETMFLGEQELEQRDLSTGALSSFLVADGLDAVFAVDKRQGGTTRSFGLLADEQSTVRILADEVGMPVRQYTYGDFGEPQLSPGSASVESPFRFAGRPLDAESGLTHMRHRYYDPQSGRFTTPDPIGAWGDPHSLGNAYAYAGNNPTTFQDPLGQRDVISRNAPPSFSMVLELPREVWTGDTIRAATPREMQLARQHDWWTGGGETYDGHPRAGSPQFFAQFGLTMSMFAGPIAAEIKAIQAAVAAERAAAAAASCLPRLSAGAVTAEREVGSFLTVNFGQPGRVRQFDDIVKMSQYFDDAEQYVGNLGKSDLTKFELGAIQQAVDKTGREVFVVGGKVKGVHKVEGAIADIDYSVWRGTSTHELHGILPKIDPDHGILRHGFDPNKGPAILFRPFEPPKYLRGH